MERITINETKFAAWLAQGDWFLPAIDVEDPGQDVVAAIDHLVETGVITLPAGYTTSILSDFDGNGAGLIVSVMPALTGRGVGHWPLLSDGWSDIDNYLPSIDDTPKPEDTEQLAKLYREMVAMVVGRLDRCIQFGEAVREMREFVGEIAADQFDPQAIAERAAALLSRRTLY